MQFRTALASNLALLSLLAAAAHGDVVIAGPEHTAERMKDPTALDREDAYCSDKAIGAVCRIPGNAFQGGGAGKCERQVNEAEYSIDLRCTLAAPVEIDRGLPAGPHRIDERVCGWLAADPGQRERLAKQGMVCAAVPAVSDRFCAGRSAGAACTAEMRVAGKNESNQGVCRVLPEEVSFKFRGRQQAARDVLRCEPAKPTPEPEIKPVGLWRHLVG